MDNSTNSTHSINDNSRGREDLNNDEAPLSTSNIAHNNLSSSPIENEKNHDKVNRYHVQKID